MIAIKFENIGVDLQGDSRCRRREVPVRNNPGIYKVLRFDKSLRKWIDSGKFLSTRRSRLDGKSRREKAAFSNLEDAKAFRAGDLEKSKTGQNVHRISRSDTPEALTFGAVLDEWKNFHFLRIRPGTRLFYERKLHFFKSLEFEPIATLDRRRVDRLLQNWIYGYGKSRGRQCFDKELTILIVILNFYRSRYDDHFSIPVGKDHFEAGTVVRKTRSEVQSLTDEDLARFFAELGKHEMKVYFPLALAQFGLSLRIGEACGLFWEDIDLELGIATIRRSIIWNDLTWEASIQDGTKNGSSRRLAMPDLLLQVLREWKTKSSQSSGLVFRNEEGGPLIRKDVGSVYNAVLRRLGINYVSGTHMLRKTSATSANDITGDFYAVSKVLGHSSVSVTERYVKSLPSQQRKVAEALNSVLERSILARCGPHGEWS